MTLNVYKGGQEIAKVTVPDLLLIRGRITRRLRHILIDLISEGEICTK